MQSHTQHNDHSSVNKGMRLSLRRVRRRRGTPQVLDSDTPMSNIQDFTYLVAISIGGQDFWLTFDTGSSDLWVVSSNCTSSDCTTVPSYSRSPSLALSNTPFRIRYLMGTVLGTVGYDVVSLGSYQISSQSFAMANETAGFDLATTGNSGILGLSFALAATIPQTVGRTILDTMFANLDDSHRFFAFKLGRNETQDLGLSDSSFTLGQLDPAVVNDTSLLTYTPVSNVAEGSYDFWKLPLQGLTIDNKSLPISSSLMPGATSPIAVLDSGTTLVLGPSIDVTAFWNAVGTGGTTRYNEQMQLWEVRCDRAIDVRIMLGGDNSTNTYPIHPEDISWADGSTTDGWCTGGIQANDGVNSGDWLLGDVFLRNVYVVHQGMTSSQPPMIGLFSITDPSLAIPQFQQGRGVSTAPPPNIVSQAPWNNSTKVDLACTLSAFGGLLCGALVTVLILHLRRRAKRHV